MNLTMVITAGFAVGGALVGSAGAAVPIYAQHLVDRALAANPDVRGLELVVAGDANTKGASFAAGAAPPAAAGEVAAAKAGRTAIRGSTVVLPLLDASDRTVGALEVAFAHAPDTAKAEAIRDSIKRRVSHTKNLLEPTSADATIPTDTYAQHLVDEELAKHPDVVILAIHATPPGKKGYPILGSNIGRIGKLADEDDMHVITTGEPKLEYNETKDRYEVEEAQHDVNGEIIGATGVVFNYKPGDDVAAHKVEADQIERDLAHRISHEGNLVDAYPYSKMPTDTYAQALVDKTMAAHPDLIILAIHATPPGSKVNVIEGSNIGRIGKVADADDLRVIDTGSNNQEINKDGKRFEAEVPLLDKNGHRIGALGCVFSFKPGATKDALYKHALEIRDEMAAQIASPADLVRRTQLNPTPKRS